MKVKLWGVRGSIPVTGPETSYYGGNTSCVDVWEDGCQLVLDGGSGIQRFSMNTTLDSKRIDILLTHLHLDHIQGLGFFKPLFDPDMDVHIWGPASSLRTLHSRLSRYLSPPLFPVLIRDLPCKLTLHEIENSQFSIGPFTIQSRYIIHPGPTVGFRVSSKNSTFTFIPDHEPALGKDGMINDPKWISGIELAMNADLLLHDAQFSSEEYQQRKGWGHSSMSDAALFASMAKVKHLLLSHHDPSRTDIQLNNQMTEFSKANNYSFKNELAKEGVEYFLE